MPNPPTVILVAGVSGSGKTTVDMALEELKREGVELSGDPVVAG